MGHYAPVAERPYPFLAAVDVFQLGLVGNACGRPRQNILATLLSILSMKEMGKIIPISSVMYVSSIMGIVAFPTENISTAAAGAAELISACASPMSGVAKAMDDALDSNITGAVKPCICKTA